MPGGRTNIDWCFPNSTTCSNTLRDIAHLYLNGNAEFGLKSHQIPVFTDERGRATTSYSKGGKVLDRLSKVDRNDIFLSENDK